jgi:hypothetical protein
MPKKASGDMGIRRTNLKHGQEEMLLATFILVTINSKHYGLKEGIDLGHRDQTAKMGNVSRL